MRQVRPQGPDQFELFWTLYGFEEDEPALAEHRLLQVNMGGPAGFVASEDEEVGPEPGEFDGDGPSDAASRAGDERRADNRLV